MKFAKELEQDLVPEWTAKYLDYKTGKKKVKAVARALKGVNQTPSIPGRRGPANLFQAAAFQSSAQHHSPIDSSFVEIVPNGRNTSRSSLDFSNVSPPDVDTTSAKHFSGSSTAAAGESPIFFKKPWGMDSVERRPLKFDDESRSPWDSGTMTNYGSIMSSPPAHIGPVGPPALELPDPAISPNHEDSFPRHNRAWRNSRLNPNATPTVRRTASTAGDAYEVGRTHTPSKINASLLQKHKSLFKPRRTLSTPDGGLSPARPPLLRRLFSTAGLESPQGDLPLQAYKEFDLRQGEYFNFLDKQLEMIESFYRMKEEEAGHRLRILREQLHVMRDRRMEEVIAAQKLKEQTARDHEHLRQVNAHGSSHNADGGQNPSTFNWMKPIGNAIGVGGQHFGKNTKALEQMGSPPGPTPRYPADHARADSRRDFTRRPTYHDDVPYQSAKRKLKLALQEFYRGLELLKAYALLNRTAFRKISKKYDKAVNARPTGRYMSEKVNKAWFVQSEVLDGQIVAVEDLYARYFERGNHKVAVGKLRSKKSRDANYSGSVFRNGFMIATGLVFAIQGLVYGTEHLSDPDPVVRINASYLLQIYGGYFLGLFLFLLFCIDCRVWSQAKINYVFIFEFDSRHNLDWRQLSELPCFFLLLEGLFLWLNFQQSGSDAMFLYWPVVLVGLTVLILFCPGPILYHRSRQWFAYSNFRLLLAGLYPVEFRDFFLGDMYCSETYAMGNLELFFCLYARHWNNPGLCNSTNSRLLGFFTTLPGIWRALQCLRRYYDTQNGFPHLVNCGKYTFTILFYMTLSMYRIDKVMHLKALFIACATINSVYTSVWDLAMDWSLCNPYAKHPFLRDVLGYKRPWVYYLAMILDPILRFNWIFYAIFSNDLQHSAVLSFVVGLSEICRRGIWTLFRVENEHCTNVGRFRASRDVPLPYDIPSPTSTPPEDHHISPDEPPSPGTIRPPVLAQPTRPHATSGADLESALTGGTVPSSGSLRRRQNPQTPIQRGINRVGTIMAQAHAQDFERKRRPVEAGLDGKGDAVQDTGGSSDEEEDQDNEQDVLDAQNILSRHRSATNYQGEGERSED